MEAAEPPSSDAGRRPRWPRVVGGIGCASVAAGYVLEAIRTRGSCETGDKSPDTLALEIVLIVWVGGLLQIIAIAGTLVVARRRGWTARDTAAMALPSLVSLAGALAIFVVGGQGPSTWFQHCGT